MPGPIGCRRPGVTFCLHSRHSYQPSSYSSPSSSTAGTLCRQSVGSVRSGPYVWTWPARSVYRQSGSGSLVTHDSWIGVTSSMCPRPAMYCVKTCSIGEL
jgi:hypothetical protein